MRGLRLPVFLVALCLLTVPRSASAQSTNPPGVPIPKSWSLDVSGMAGISPGFGDSTSALRLEGNVTFVRVSEPSEFSHRCLGLTFAFAAEPDEQAILTGPRWDAGDQEGTGYFRLLGGVRRVSSTRADATGQHDIRENIIGVGAGVGFVIGNVLMDVTWVMSPWEPEARHRVTFSLGYTWSWRLTDK